MKMNTLTRLTMTGAMALALAACNASGDDEGGGGVLSSGVVTTELPTDAERAILSPEVNAVIDAFANANETLPAPSALPTGTATYTGTSAFGLSEQGTDDLLATLSGDARLEVDFDASGTAVTARFDNFTGIDIAEGGTVTVNNGEIVMSNGVITGTEFAGGVAGNVNVTVTRPAGSETIDFNIGAGLDGAFAGADAKTAIGTVDGVATSADGDDNFSGVFFTQTP